MSFKKQLVISTLLFVVSVIATWSYKTLDDMPSVERSFVICSYAAVVFDGGDNRHCMVEYDRGVIAQLQSNFR